METMRLSRSDLEAVLGFLGDACQLESDRLYPAQFLARLQVLIPSTWVVYQEADHVVGRFTVTSAIGPDTDDDEDDGRIYWTLGPCPTQDHRMRTGDLRSVRTSDLLQTRAYHQLPIYQDYFRPASIEHIMDLGLPASPGHTRSLVLMRERGAPNFSERDREVTEVLRPHLRQIEAHVQLRQELTEVAAGHPRPGGGPEDLRSLLTQREREIVELVASGKTNGEIAAILWVAPSTVKKHLENVYAKAGVGRRSAIVALHRTRQ